MAAAAAAAAGPSSSALGDGSCVAAFSSSALGEGGLSAAHEARAAESAPTALPVTARLTTVNTIVFEIGRVVQESLEDNLCLLELCSVRSGGNSSHGDQVVVAPCDRVVARLRLRRNAAEPGGPVPPLLVACQHLRSGRSYRLRATFSNVAGSCNFTKTSAVFTTPPCPPPVPLSPGRVVNTEIMAERILPALGLTFQNYVGEQSVVFGGGGTSMAGEAAWRDTTMGDLRRFFGADDVVTGGGLSEAVGRRRTVRNGWEEIVAQVGEGGRNVGGSAGADDAGVRVGEQQSLPSKNGGKKSGPHVSGEKNGGGTDCNSTDGLPAQSKAVLDEALASDAVPVQAAVEALDDDSDAESPKKPPAAALFIGKAKPTMSIMPYERGFSLLPGMILDLSGDFLWTLGYSPAVFFLRTNFFPRCYAIKQVFM